MNKILIASDHAGYNLKSALIQENTQYTWQDLGTNNNHDSVDYPDYAHSLCQNLKLDDIGILICGSGIGMSIVANRYQHIRAALCYCLEYAQLAKKHNNANLLILGARFISKEHATLILKAFIETTFEEGRHITRIQKI